MVMLTEFNSARSAKGGCAVKAVSQPTTGSMQAQTVEPIIYDASEVTWTTDWLEDLDQSIHVNSSYRTVHTRTQGGHGHMTQ